LGSGLRGAGLRAGLADLPAERRLATDARFLVRAAGLAFRAGLRLEEVRAFPARRNFAMPDG